MNLDDKMQRLPASAAMSSQEELPEDRAHPAVPAGIMLVSGIVSCIVCAAVFPAVAHGIVEIARWSWNLVG